MRLRPNFSYVWLALVWTFCLGFEPVSAQYESLFGRHGEKWQGAARSRFTADMLILGRGSVDPLDVLYSIPSAGPITPLLNTSELDLDVMLSGRYDLILVDRSSYELQFTLTGFPNGQNAQATRTDPDIRAVLFGGVSALESGNPSSVFSVRYDSRLGSGEVNIRRRWGPQVTLFSGFRAVVLQEDLDFLDATPGINKVLATRADNSLYGWQLGADCTVWSSGWASVNVSGRGGVFLNHQEVGLITADPADSSLSIHYQRQSDRTAFAGDLQATLAIPLGAGSLRIGYQVLFLNGVALVPDQLDSVNFFTDTGAIDQTNTVYQGGFVGLEVPF